MIACVAGFDGALDKLGKERLIEDVAHVRGDQDADDARAARGEAARSGVGVEVEEADCLLNACTGFLADPALPVDDAGDGRAGDPSLTCDFFQIHGIMSAISPLCGSNLGALPVVVQECIRRGPGVKTVGVKLRCVAVSASSLSPFHVRISHFG